MSKTQACANCRFFSAGGVFAKTVCRRFPPQIKTQVWIGQGGAKFPDTTKDDWCGEWLPRS